MEYVKDILVKSGSLGKSRQCRTRNKRFVNVAPCAYCAGTGVDPKYGNMSCCTVCGGKGEVKVTPPRCHLPEMLWLRTRRR